MAYLIEGEHRPVVYCANYRVGGTATADTLIQMGAVLLTDHHARPGDLPEETLIVQTIRNHFDVIASFYYREGKPCSFEDYVNVILDGNHPYLEPDGFYKRFGEWDYILSYNTLQLEFDTMCLYAGLPATKIKATHTKRKASQRWQDLFTTRLQNKVADRYSEELERIGYGVN